MANPDLVFYRGESQEQYDKDGKRLVQNIYSRPWNINESKEVPVEVTLQGKWNVMSNDGFVKVTVRDNETLLLFMCRHGASINVQLSK